MSALNGSVAEVSESSVVAPRLLVYLRRALASPALSYSAPPERITGGFDTRIYGFHLHGASHDFAAPLILRVFRPDCHAEQPRVEAAVLRTAASQGFPVPRVLLVETDTSPLGSTFIVMQRVPGRLMLDGFFGPGVFRLPVLLAATHLRLHELDALAFRDAVQTAGCDVSRLSAAEDIAQAAQAVERCALAGLRPGIRWLTEHRPAEPHDPVVCHGDFHPLNILIDAHGVTGVIDWSPAHLRIADRAYDVGATIALMSQGPVNVPRILQGVVRFVRRRLVDRYVRAYLTGWPIDPHLLEYYEALRCVGFLVEAGEHLQAEAGVVPPVIKPTAFAAPLVRRSIIARIQQITGLNLTLPGK